MEGQTSQSHNKPRAKSWPSLPMLATGTFYKHKVRDHGDLARPGPRIEILGLGSQDKIAFFLSFKIPGRGISYFSFIFFLGWWKPNLITYSRSDPDSKQRQKQGLYQSDSICNTLRHLWRSQNVTFSNSWPDLFLWIFFGFFSKTDFATLQSLMSQMVTHSNLTGTNLFVFLFSRKLFGMNEIQSETV